MEGQFALTVPKVEKSHKYANIKDRTQEVF